MTFASQHPSIHNSDITSPTYWRDMVMKRRENIFPNYNDNQNHSHLRSYYFNSHDAGKVVAMRQLINKIKQDSGDNIRKKFEESDGGNSGDNNKQQTIPTKAVKNKEDNLTKVMKERMELSIRALAASILAESGGEIGIANKILSNGGKEIIDKLSLQDMNKLVGSLQIEQQKIHLRQN